MDFELEQGFKRLLRSIGSKGIAWIKAPSTAQHGHAAHAAFSAVTPNSLAPFVAAAQLRASLKNRRGTFGSQYIVLDPTHLTNNAKKAAWVLRTHWDFRKNRDRAWLQLIAVYHLPTVGGKAQFQSLTLRHEPPEKRKMHRFWHMQACVEVGGGSKRIAVPLAAPIPKFLQSYPAVPLRAQDSFQALLALLLSVYGDTPKFWSPCLLELKDYQAAFKHAIEFIRSCCPELAQELKLQPAAI